MNRSQLIERLKELDVAIKQTLSNFNALEGARQECELWLKKEEEADNKGE